MKPPPFGYHQTIVAAALDTAKRLREGTQQWGEETP